MSIGRDKELENSQNIDTATVYNNNFKKPKSIISVKPKQNKTK